jgi:hypothetical protein
MKILEFIKHALRKAFAPERKKPSRTPFKAIPYGQGGVFAGVDLDDTSGLLDIMDGIEAPKKK